MIEVFIVKIPMQSHFGHAQLSRQYSESVILRLTYNGIIGIGECAPRKYVTGETCESVKDFILNMNISEIFGKLDFSNLDNAVHCYLHIYDQIRSYFPLNVLCLIELAILDIIGKYFKKSLTQIIQKYLLAPIISDESNFRTTTQVLDYSLNVGDFLKTRGPFAFIKVKLGNNVSKNRNVLSNLRTNIGYQIPISVDANMNWTLEMAMTMVEELAEFDIQYYEEPLKPRSWIAYQELRKSTRVKILLDESVCTIHDAYDAYQNFACDAINIRISKNGGLINALKLILLCRKENLSYQIGAQVAEVGPLIAAGRHLAFCVNDNFTYEAGQPDRYFNQYLVNPMPLIDRSNNLATPIYGHGLGVSLSKEFSNFYE